MKVPTRYRTLLALVILILSHQTYPQTHIPEKIQFKHFTKENGLSDNFIMSILKDSKGFIWIGTLDGLNRYDGKKIKVYRYSIEDPNSLGANEQYGHINNDPLIENHFSRDWEHSIFQRSMQVLKESKEKKYSHSRDCFEDSR